MFGTKSKGLFIDVVGDCALAARTSSPAAPYIIEELREIDLSDAEAAAGTIRSMVGARGTAYVPARCAIYPPNRVISRVAVDGRKLREESYLASHVGETLKIDTNAYSLFTLSAVDGSDIASAKTTPKEILVCGAPALELTAQQERLLSLGVFPEGMELGTIASIGGVISHLAFTDAKSPTLLLEIGSDVTQVFVVSRDGVEVTRSVAFGVSSMIPLVQKELALKDEDSARKLFFSNNFDFTGMGPQLTKRLLRELQASIGFYEVQTGQSIGQLCCTLLPSKVSWLQRTLADVLGMKLMTFDYAGWLASMGITLAPGVGVADLSAMWTSLFCLMGEYQGRADEAAA